ncbi:class I SAM-dependent methyltransferase [Nocardia camponoti]|nr:class I SAM-dependent methyltransferase [Nocardia camponoti]
MFEGSQSEVLTEFLVSARSLSEYRAMFALSPRDLAGRDILDCPGGAASFTAEANRVGARAVAVDPIYATSPNVLAEQALVETERAVAWAHHHAERYRWDFYGTLDAQARVRRAAATRFAADVRVAPERYYFGALPSLPFADNSFDLALSSHLLFSYADRLDATFHVKALLELSRVARQVRAYPLLDYLGNPLDELVDRVRKELSTNGITTSLVRVDYEFHHGAHTMLVADRSN